MSTVKWNVFGLIKMDFSIPKPVEWENTGQFCHRRHKKQEHAPILGGKIGIDIIMSLRRKKGDKNFQHRNIYNNIVHESFFYLLIKVAWYLDLIPNSLEAFDSEVEDVDTIGE